MQNKHYSEYLNLALKKKLKGVLFYTGNIL